MLKVNREPTFTHEVSVMTPVDGGHVEEKLKVTYRVLPTERAAKFQDDEEGNREFLKAILVKLDDLVDDKNEPVPYSEELRDRLLGMPHIRRALQAAYFAAVSKAKTGN